MSINQVNNISKCLSLRKPQIRSLEILNRITEIIKLSKDEDTAEQLRVIKSEFPTVEGFDRDFLSVCFALATGVGKTRLMGAFIAYLYLEHGLRHFFILAPNLTIYNKLIADFTLGTPKYVFRGVGEFARNPPLIITGDNYESGIGVRQGNLPGSYFDPVHINIFNISKITARDKGNFADDDERRNLSRFRRLREELGESYFDYLANLDDLVVLMDESHRYRADAGMSAINELKPILGLELTATPQIERNGKTTRFGNIIYDYPLSNAMTDGFVKEPAVATRENFTAANYTESGLEQVKLEDGIRIHENTKVDLDTYARNRNLPVVKPFMLVVAKDTTHAGTLQAIIESDNFFNGGYKGKVIQVHSSLKGEEKDENVAQLLSVEDPKNPVEIVIHVNMLKEGWDVTNLYTIVPLRAANSKTLVEQSIGRGLRLPYGKRTGEPAVDRLTIVAHDKFQEIIDYANSPDSILSAGSITVVNVPEPMKKTVEIKPYLHQVIGGAVQPHLLQQERPEPLFKTPGEIAVAQNVIEVIYKEFNRNGCDLKSPEIIMAITEKVEQNLAPAQMELEIGGKEKINIPDIVVKVVDVRPLLSIDIPRIVVQPTGKVRSYFKPFTVDVSRMNYQVPSQDILIKHLHDRELFRLRSGDAIVEEKRPEDYIVRGFFDVDDVDYFENAALLYNLAGQVVEHLYSYLKTEDNVIKVLQYHQQGIVKAIHAQMQDYFVEEADNFEAVVAKGFHQLQGSFSTVGKNEDIRNFWIDIPAGERQQIKSMVFGGFKKCLYSEQKFDSNTERRFAVILEQDPTVQKWLKPAMGDLKIYYDRVNSYTPDFVVETMNCKYICETKAQDEMDDRIVLAKAKAAKTFCQNATKCVAHDKPWKYLLIPHDAVTEDKTLSGLEKMFSATC